MSPSSSMHAKHLLVAFVAALAGSACSWEQAYYAAQTWQRNECSKLPDSSERDRCANRAGASYDAYRRQTEEGRPK